MIDGKEARSAARLAAALLIPIMFVECTFLACAQRSAPRAPNIILISIDTLRADHLGCYGYARATTPFIDTFRREAILFRTSIAAAPSTLPSHASIFTSLPPQHHGASHTKNIPLADRFVTITEVLRQAGYGTAAFTGGGQLAPEFGLTQGFDSYAVVEDGTFEQVVARASAFLGQPRTKPFFLFLHTYEVHHPYTAAPEELALFEQRTSSSLPSRIEIDLLARINWGGLKINDADRDHIVNAYDAEIHSMDRGFGLLVAELKRLGIYDNSIIVFTSDHGEEFNEHGWMGWHSHTLYDELMKTPLVVRLPGSAHRGEEIGGVVRGIDIAPLILEAAGLPPHPQFQQFSLAQTLTNRHTESAPALLWRESPPADTKIHQGLRTSDWKLIDGRLYDLNHDPRELEDVAARYPTTATELTKTMNTMIHALPRPETLTVTPDPETIKRLRTLGYLQ